MMMGSCACFLMLYITAVSSVCDRGWVWFEDNCYSFNKEKLSWFDAAATCLVYGARLVQIETQGENQFLATQLQTANIGDAWLGGSARLHGAVWEWVPSLRLIGGEDTDSGHQGLWNQLSSKLPKKLTEWLPGSKPPTDYLNWADGEPNDKADSGEDCMQISSYLNYQWNDLQCVRKLSFICEKED